MAGSALETMAASELSVCFLLRKRVVGKVASWTVLVSKKQEFLCPYGERVEAG